MSDTPPPISFTAELDPDGVAELYRLIDAAPTPSDAAELIAEVTTSLLDAMRSDVALLLLGSWKAQRTPPPPEPNPAAEAYTAAIEAAKRHRGIVTAAPPGTIHPLGLVKLLDNLIAELDTRRTIAQQEPTT